MLIQPREYCKKLKFLKCDKLKAHNIIHYTPFCVGACHKIIQSFS